MIQCPVRVLRLAIEAMDTGPLAGTGDGKVQQVSVGRPLRARAWYHVWGSYDADRQTPVGRPNSSGDGLSGDDAGAASSHLDRSVSSPRLVDAGPHGPHSELVNLPARGMTGCNWTGREMCWRHTPEQYGAIHFHEDDFSFTVPAEFKSGVYAMRLTCGTVSDMIPFFVRPRPGHPQTDAVSGRDAAGRGYFSVDRFRFAASCFTIVMPITLNPL